MKTIFYTICDTAMQQSNNRRNLDFQGFVNSFKKFHSDIELRIFNENDLAANGVNFYNAKAHFGKMLSENYDLVVNVDADHYFFDRCHEILNVDYDIACPANYNQTDNLVGIKVSSGINGEGKPNYIVDTKHFLQGGLIASANKDFWNHYEYATRCYWDKFVCFENDILNLVAHLLPYAIKYLDGHYNYLDKNHTQWYGCSIIGKEKNAVIDGNMMKVDGKPIRAYHFAHGSAKKSYKDVFPVHTHLFIESIIK